MSFITSIGTAVPKNRVSQKVLAEFMLNIMELDVRNRRLLRSIFASSGISFRHSVLDDYSMAKAFQFYSNSPDFEPFPSTEKRLIEYRKNALQLGIRAIENCLQKRGQLDLQSITHLITVSCTGMYAPGLDIDIVRVLGLRRDIERTAINFMGCYAAFNAIKIGHAFCSGKAEARILIVCVELCSLHFQKSNTEDNLLSNALFGDGAAALLMESNHSGGLNLKPVAFCNALSITAEQDMAWTVGDFGFKMKLSSSVPDVIQVGIRSLVATMLNKIDKNILEIEHFAVHPGGKKILDVVEGELEITKFQNRHAYRILNDFGNMSSPTILFVLNEILESAEISGKKSSVLSLAFGPGLTLESILFEMTSS